MQREFEKLKKKLLALSALVEESVVNAVKSIRDHDAALAHQVIDGDMAIDEREVDIEEECQKVLALHQPVAHDLRFIIAVLKINNELERIGDASVNIAERSLFLVKDERIDIPFDFTGMAEKAHDMLHRSLDALVNEDASLAFAVIAADDEVDAINREMYGQVKDGIRRHPEHLEALIHLLSVARHVERIGDHASNIAEDVIYLIKGEIVRHKSEDFTPRHTP
ncbi:MAG: phosphate signaling complex protein PhoU [Candidatus Hydrogenedentales bacterium]|jgi:phosphate transport system protein